SLHSYWINSYWGGAVAALGGALAIGALPRILRRRQLGDVLWLLIGLGLLANTRTLEGFAFSLPLLATITLWFVAHRTQKALWRQVAIPFVLGAALLAGWMGYYNFRGTGSVVTSPYVVNFREYHLASPFFGQPLRPEPQYRVPQMKSMYEKLEVRAWQLSRTLPGTMVLFSLKNSMYGNYYV